MIAYQYVMTFLICYVIRLFFSGKIEQAPKTDANGDFEKGRTVPVFLQVVDGSMVRDGTMEAFWQNRTGPEQVFLG